MEQGRVVATTPRRRRRRGRRVGHAVGLVVGAVALYVVNHLLEWGWPSFLTPDFDQVIGLVNLSIVAGMAADALLVVVDSVRLEQLVGAVTAAIAFAATLRMLQVFPFDFAGWDRDWSGLLRVLLVLGLVGTALAVVANLVQFLTGVGAGRPAR